MKAQQAPAWLPQASLLLPRPRVVVTPSELQAHEARLERLRKKAGRALWDAPELDEVAVAS